MSIARRPRARWSAGSPRFPRRSACDCSGRRRPPVPRRPERADRTRSGVFDAGDGTGSRGEGRRYHGGMVHSAARIGSFLLVAAPLSALAIASADSPRSSAAPAPPPAAKVDPVTDTFHGQQVVDEYRWLEALEKDSKEVADWTTAQNDYTRARLDALACRSKVEEALRPLMQIGSISAPRMGGNFYIYTERSGTQNQPVVK
ncbi:MAG: hypothetical protein FJ253_07090, partial [Phycisphaerae bacterium]|nr:hypothetical protein [Phycisphaerae bacterium]